MASSAVQIRTYRGPALFSYGFRPFFFFGALWAAIAVAVWIPFLTGRLALPTHLAPLDWHVHELLFGFVPAVVAGFLLTAVPNWTGRLPVVGPKLAALFALWALGRMAVLMSAWIGAGLAAIIDISFLAVLGLVIGREIIAGSSWRNAKVLVAIVLMGTANGLYHAESMGIVPGTHGKRLGLAVILMLIMLIGGRIIPSFTRNWLARQQGARLPIPFNMLDGLVMVDSAIVLLLWIVLPDSILTGSLAAVIGVLHFVRLSRWAGDRTASEPLVLVLHVAYAFVPLGFLLLAGAILLPNAVPVSAAIHAWTAGGIGLMTLAVMTRASLGHTGQALTATPGIQAIYALATISALARILAALGLWPSLLLDLAALGWVLAFTGFVIIYAPLLLRRTA